MVDDNVRQADYKYTYADRTMINEKSSKADLLVQAIEKFAQQLPLDLPEIFIWYFEQKGVENPERFLAQQQPINPQEALTQAISSIGQAQQEIPAQVSNA